MKLTHTEVKFYLKVKCQTSLSSLWVSCNCALRLVFKNYFVCFDKSTYVLSYEIRAMLNHYLLSSSFTIPGRATCYYLCVYNILYHHSHIEHHYIFEQCFKAFFIRFELSALCKAFLATWRD